MALRASDDDRRRVLAVLERHTTAGRLRLDEFDQRVTTTLRATTLDDLAAVVQDLPDDPPATMAPARDAGVDALLFAFGIAVITIVILGAVLALAH